MLHTRNLGNDKCFDVWWCLSASATRGYFFNLIFQLIFKIKASKTIFLSCSYILHAKKISCECSWDLCKLPICWWRSCFKLNKRKNILVSVVMQRKNCGRKRACTDQSKYLLKVAESDACGIAVLLIEPFLNLFVSTRTVLFNLLFSLCRFNIHFK